MIKIAIVEDEAAVRDQLTDYVRRYTRQYGTEFEVTCFTDGDRLKNLTSLRTLRPATLKQAWQTAASSIFQTRFTLHL